MALLVHGVVLLHLEPPEVLLVLDLLPLPLQFYDGVVHVVVPVWNHFLEAVPSVVVLHHFLLVVVHEGLFLAHH